MTQLLSAVAFSTTLTHLISPISRWNNRTMTLAAALCGASAACLALGIYIAYRIWGPHRVPPRTPPLSQRYLDILFPHQKNPLLATPQDLPFTVSTPGIISLDKTHFPPDINPTEIYIQCVYQNRHLFFFHPMTSSDSAFNAFVPDLPYGEEIAVNIFHFQPADLTHAPRQKELITTKFTVDLQGGLYKIIADTDANCYVESHQQLFPILPTPLVLNMEKRDPIAPLTISISPQDKVAFLPSGVKQVRNESTKTYLLFFKILGVDPTNRSCQREIIAPVVASPGITYLPEEFFKRSWRQTSSFLPTRFHDYPILQLHSLHSTPLL